MKIITQSVRFTADQKLLAYIEQKLASLEQYFDKIIQADVFLKLENTGKIKEKTVEVRLKVPGETIYISDKKQKFEAAVDAVIEKLKRSVKKYKQQLRSR